MLPKKPKPYDFSVHNFEFLSVYGIEKLAGVLAKFQLQDDDFFGKQDYFQKLEERKAEILMIIQNLVVAGDLHSVISKETREACDDLDGIEACQLIEEVPCIRLDEFASWAVKQKNFKCPQGILAKAPKGSGSKEGITDNTRTVDGLLKMVIAMAIDCYGYDPNDKKSTTTSDISNALAKCGLSLSENTIRKRLDQAQEYLPQDNKQEKDNNIKP